MHKIQKKSPCILRFQPVKCNVRDKELGQMDHWFDLESEIVTLQHLLW